MEAGDVFGNTISSLQASPLDAVSGAAMPEAQIPERPEAFSMYDHNGKQAVMDADEAKLYMGHLESQLAALRVERDQWEKKSHEWFQKYSTTLNWGCHEHDIVARIWAMFGTPSYEELKGRSIYDLINELRGERDRAWNEGVREGLEVAAGAMCGWCKRGHEPRFAGTETKNKWTHAPIGQDVWTKNYTCRAPEIRVLLARPIPASMPE